MHGFWHYPALPIGAALLVIGLGNWVASRDKVLEYTRRAQLSEPLDRPGSLEEFKRLTPQTNAALLERLHRGLGEYGVADAKRDFYTVVQSGGRFIAVSGLLSIGIGLLQRWRQRRLTRLALGVASGGATPPAPVGGL
ncbi:MAG: hypothetical protein ACRERC_24785 [Candidatus Binatia bacterium]